MDSKWVQSTGPGVIERSGHCAAFSVPTESSFWTNRMCIRLPRSDFCQRRRPRLQIGSGVERGPNRAAFSPSDPLAYRCRARSRSSAQCLADRRQRRRSDERHVAEHDQPTGRWAGSEHAALQARAQACDRLRTGYTPHPEPRECASHLGVARPVYDRDLVHLSEQGFATGRQHRAAVGERLGELPAPPASTTAQMPGGASLIRSTCLRAPQAPAGRVAYGPGPAALRRTRRPAQCCSTRASALAGSAADACRERSSVWCARGKVR